MIEITVVARGSLTVITAHQADGTQTAQQLPELLIKVEMPGSDSLEEHAVVALGQLHQVAGLSKSRAERLFEDDILTRFQGAPGIVIMGAVDKGHIHRVGHVGSQQSIVVVGDGRKVVAASQREGSFARVRPIKECAGLNLGHEAECFEHLGGYLSTANNTNFHRSNECLLMRLKSEILFLQIALAVKLSIEGAPHSVDLLENARNLIRLNFRSDVAGQVALAHPGTLLHAEKQT